MQRIYPVTKEACKPHCGKMVMLLMKDGSEIHGHLSRVEGGCLILNEPPGVATTKAYNGKRKAAKGAMKTKALGTPLSGRGFRLGRGFGTSLALDIAFIAALFVI